MRPQRRTPPLEATADILDLAHDGRGIARPQGKVVFVAGALPGERVRLAVTRRGRDADEGNTLAVEAPSPHRVEPKCPHFGLCGGCSLQHLEPAQQILFKQKQLLDALARIGKVEAAEVVAPLTGPAWGYRRRARLAVKHVPKKGGVLVGFRERETPLIAAIDSCEVLDPRVGRKLTALSELIGGLTVRAKLPQIEVAAADHVALVFRVLEAPTAEDRARIAEFAQREGFEIYLQPGGLDSVQPLTPPARTLEYSPDGSALRLAFLPTDFIQVNGGLNRRMVGQALDWLRPSAGDRVLELFAGLGNFTLPIAAAGARVTAVEGEAGLVRRGRENAERNGLAVRYEVADLFNPDPQARWLQDEYELALLDPPRAGAREMLPFVARKKPARIVYVSCHPGTLARDAGLLAREHGYRLVRAGVMDMFPHTAHVESMALFEAR